MKRTPRRRVILNIDGLVLKGVRYEDRHAVAQGLQEQLTQLFSEPSRVQQLSELGSIHQLRVGSVQVASDAKPQHVGVAAADGIAKGLNR